MIATETGNNEDRQFTTVLNDETGNGSRCVSDGKTGRYIGNRRIPTLPAPEGSSLT